MQEAYSAPQGYCLEQLGRVQKGSPQATAQGERLPGNYMGHLLLGLSSFAGIQTVEEIHHRMILKRRHCFQKWLREKQGQFSMQPLLSYMCVRVYSLLWIAGDYQFGFAVSQLFRSLALKLCRSCIPTVFKMSGSTLRRPMEELLFRGSHVFLQKEGHALLEMLLASNSERLVGILNTVT